MAEIPEDIKTSLKSLAKSSKTDVKVLVGELKDILENNATIQTMEIEEHKIRFAYGLLLNRYTSTGGAVQLYLKPFSKPRARLAKSKGVMKYVGGCYGLVKLVGKDDKGNPKIGEAFPAAGTLWEKAAEVSQVLSPDKVYKTSLRATETTMGIELGGNDATFTEVSDVKFPTTEEYFKEHILPDIDNLVVRLADLPISHREGLLDIKVIKGIVTDSRKGTGKQGDYGTYVLVDDSLIGAEEGGPTNYTIWVNPEDVKYDTGTNLYAIGTVNVDARNPENVVARFDCWFTIPVPGGVVIEKKEEAIPVAKESISPDDLPAEEPPKEAEPTPAEQPKEEKPPEQPKEEPKKEEPTVSDDDFAI